MRRLVGTCVLSNKGEASRDFPLSNNPWGTSMPLPVRWSSRGPYQPMWMRILGPFKRTTLLSSTSFSNCDPLVSSQIVFLLQSLYMAGSLSFGGSFRTSLNRRSGHFFLHHSPKNIYLLVWIKVWLTSKKKLNARSRSRNNVMFEVQEAFQKNLQRIKLWVSLVR